MAADIRFEQGARSCAKALSSCLSILYDRIGEGLVPQLVELGPRTRGLPIHEIDALNAGRMAGLPADQIRDVVSKIMESRAFGLSAPEIVRKLIEEKLAAHRAARATATVSSAHSGRRKVKTPGNTRREAP